MSGDRARAFLLLIDHGAAIRDLGRFEATMTIAELRRHRPREHNHNEVLERAARTVLECWPLHGYARAAALGALLDVGRADEVRDQIVARLQAGHATVADLRIAARVLRLWGHRNSSVWLHELADQLRDGGAVLTADTVETIVDRLLGRWLPVGDPFETAPIGDEKELVVLEKLESPIEIPGAQGLRLRPIESRQQLDRFSHHLNNCASGYLPLVRSGATRLLGLELGGVPVELIEIHPRTGHIKQWKGHRNVAADPFRRRIVEPFLVQRRLASGF